MTQRTRDNEPTARPLDPFPDPAARPWRAEPSMLHFWMVDSDIGTVAHGCHKADARLIVRAVNLHDDLVEALRALVDETHTLVGWCNTPAADRDEGFFSDVSAVAYEVSKVLDESRAVLARVEDPR